MDQREQKAERRLARQEISDDVTPLGWRYVLGLIRTCVRAGSLAQAVEVAGRVAAAADGADDGRAADECLWMDVRRDRLIVTLQSPVTPQVTKREIAVAHRISAAVSELGLAAAADNEGAAPRSIQVMEIAIDALDIASIRPFWKAIMGYDDEVSATGPRDPLVDPLWQSPAIWFQQMDAPRPYRNRIHFDISVPHDEAQRRLRAALAAGGALVSDGRAPAFWVLADAEGNEACITTWQGRDG